MSIKHRGISEKTEMPRCLPFAGHSAETTLAGSISAALAFLSLLAVFMFIFVTVLVLAFGKVSQIVVCHITQLRSRSFRSIARKLRILHINCGKRLKHRPHYNYAALSR